MDKPKKLILDYSKWRSGDDGDYKVGTGITALRNTHGFCCCIGQWSLQLGATVDEITYRGEPNEIKTLIELFAIDDEDGRTTTPLACEAIYINDDVDTTPEEKIKSLTDLLGREGIELEVINKP